MPTRTDARTRSRTHWRAGTLARTHARTQHWRLLRCTSDAADAAAAPSAAATATVAAAAAAVAAAPAAAAAGWLSVVVSFCSIGFTARACDVLLIGVGRLLCWRLLLFAL